MNLNTARVFVRDLGAAEPFYSKQLGLPLRGGGARFGYCVYNAGSTQLIVESVPGGWRNDHSGLRRGLRLPLRRTSHDHQDLHDDGASARKVRHDGLFEEMLRAGVRTICIRGRDPFCRSRALYQRNRRTRVDVAGDCLDQTTNGQE
jgi:hypothetical protein